MGSGVNTTTVSRSYSDFLTKALNGAQSNSSSLNTYYSMLSQLNNLVGDPTTGIGAGIPNHFTNLLSVADSPRPDAPRHAREKAGDARPESPRPVAPQVCQLRQNRNSTPPN